jgi:hypothetical protein
LFLLDPGYSWADPRTFEQVLDEIGIEFEGTDPLKPRGREMLEATKQKLLRAVKVLYRPIYTN